MGLDSMAKQYNINRTSFGNHYDIEQRQGETRYRAEQWKLRTHRPDLCLHIGSDTSGPIVAVSHMPHLSNTFKIGLGDPSSPASMLWEDLGKNSFSGKGHRWSADLYSQPGEVKRSRLNWKTTKSIGVDGMKVPWSSSRNYKLVNEDTEEVVAVFTSDRSYKTCGVLQINADYGERFERMAIMTCITVYENARRQSTQRRGVAGG